MTFEYKYKKFKLWLSDTLGIYFYKTYVFYYCYPKNGQKDFWMFDGNGGCSYKDIEKEEKYKRLGAKVKTKTRYIFELGR